MTTVLPPVAALELTYRCNHACRFCSCPWFAGMIKPSAEMSVDEWKRLIDEFAANGVRQFSFTGGEALMKEGCLDLVDFASKRALVNLLSNGRIVTDDVLRFCAERGIRLSVSMPGLKSFAENTDSDTPVEHILGVFARARELGCGTTVGVAVTKLNLPELYETISAALVAGADSLLLNRFLPGGRGLSHPELMLTAEEVREVADVAEEVLSRAKFTVGPNGMIRACNHSPVEILRWNEWERLPECEEWMHFVRHDYLPEMCTDCARAAKCMGGCREAARVFLGSPSAPDPLLANGSISRHN